MEFSQTYNEDLVLRNLGINKNKKVDAIINISNIKVGPFANQTGDEFLFSFQTQTIESVTDYYYNVLNFTECFGQERGITHKFKSIPVKRTLWIMKKPIDAAFVFIDYPDQQEGIEGPVLADINLFQENAYYQFVSPLAQTIQVRFLLISMLIRPEMFKF